MKKLLFTVALTAATSITLIAQNSIFRYKTNNRNASESVDAAVYNPAGLIWLKDGVHIEIGNQLGFGGKEVYDGINETTYGGKGGSAFDPTAIFVYKKQKWAMNFAFGASSGGGGSMPDGSPMLTMGGYEVAMNMESQVNAGLIGVGLPSAIVDPFTTDLYAPNGGSLNEGALDFNFQGNIAYKISDWFSLSIGAKYLYRFKDYMEGNIALSTDEAAIANFQNDLLDLGLTQTEVVLITYQVPAVNGDVARVDAGYENNNYWKFSVGANIRPNDKLLIAQTFHFGPSYTANMKLNELYVIDPALQPALEEMLGMTFEDGAAYERKITPGYNLGIAYHVNDKLRTEANFNARLLNFQNSNRKNEYGFGLGAEYQISDLVNWGAGFKYDPVRRLQDDMNDIDYSNDFLWLASGVDLSLTERLKGVVTFELGVPTSERKYYNELNTLTKSYADKLSYSATMGVVYSF